MPGIPLWGIALALAAIAPLGVGFLADFLERKRRERTSRALRNERGAT